jgi:hypothetical protein
MSDARPPQTLPGVAGEAVKDVVSGFQGAPTLLVIVILNITMIVAAAWFLNTLQRELVKNTRLTLERCLPDWQRLPAKPVAPSLPRQEESDSR